MIRKLLIIPVLAATCYLKLSAQNDYKVLENNWLEYSDASNSLYHHLTGQAFGMLRARTDTIGRIMSAGDWQIRQADIRQRFNRIIGPFPPKTDLNPQVLRKISKDGFTVEHIVFESQPGYFVTSSLYLPSGLKRNEKLPAIIYCSGHSAEGYRSDVYQHVILNLVKKRFIVFAYDPPGQGERLEYFDSAKGASVIGGPTREHSYPGAQAFLTGSSQAMYMIWDGIRAVDYLLTRKEVDQQRIGITGRSGGGTQSAYIAAFDERIYAAAPENYLTNYTRLLQSIGPQDAEQNMPGIIAAGLDHSDLLLVRAPKPALMITTTGDMFSIQGAMETEAEVQRVYDILGKPDNFSRAEDDAGHASTLSNREAMYRFFQTHLNNPGNPHDEETESLTKEELQVTPAGQVSTSYGSESVYSLNLKTAMMLEQKTNDLKAGMGFYHNVTSDARKLSGFIDPGIPEEAVFTGRIIRKGYTIEKYFIKGEGNYCVPFLWFKPLTPSSSYLLGIHPSGKGALSLAGGLNEKIVLSGINVIAPDLPGIGEMGNGSLKGDAWFEGVSHNLWYASLIIGRSIVAVQAGDLIKIMGWIKNLDTGAMFYGYAYGSLGPVLIHASAFTENFRGLIIDHSFTSYMSLVQSKFYNSEFMMSGIGGVLAKYDLPDLVLASGSGKVMLADPVDAMGQVSDNERVSFDIEQVRKVLGRMHTAISFTVKYRGKDGFDDEEMIKWLNNKD